MFEPKYEPHLDEDDFDENSASNASMPGNGSGGMTDKNSSGAAGLNQASFLGMAAASLMDPSAAKGTIFR